MNKCNLYGRERHQAIFKCQIGKKLVDLFPFGQCVFPLLIVKYKWLIWGHNYTSRQGKIPPFESKLSPYYSPRNRFTETPLCNSGAGTYLEACIILSPIVLCLFGVLGDEIPRQVHLYVQVRCVQRRCRLSTLRAVANAMLAKPNPRVFYLVDFPFIWA